MLASIADLRGHVVRKLEAALASVGAALPVELVQPPDPKLGDFGFACFPLAKTLKKAPPLCAQQLAEQIEADQVIEAIIVAGPYLNFKLRRATFVATVLGEVLSRGDRFGSEQVSSTEHWMVEYSSPNTNKPQHLGHIRNNLLGASISAILTHYGHRLTRVNLVNDRGIHICKSMLAYERWGEGVTPESRGVKGDHLVGEFYVLFEKRFSEEYRAWQQSATAQQALGVWTSSDKGQAALKAAVAKAKKRDEPAPTASKVFFSQHKDYYFNNASPLGKEARQMLVDWERGDATTRALWQKMRGWVLDGFAQTYQRMKVGHEQTQYESETYSLGKSLVDQGLASGVLTKRADGAVVCDLTQVGLEGEKVLLRSDGTSVYMTQDLGTAIERVDTYQVDRLVYVVGDEQIYHFDVLFKVLGLLRPGLTERCYHLAYGMIRLPEGKMKSREGTVVDADDLMDEVHQLARQETEERAADGKAHTEGINEQELDHRAELIGMAALKYFLLKYSPRTSFEYDPKASIDFLGQTGPYCLFNYARTRSLLRKAGEVGEYSADLAERLQTERELEIVRLIAQFPEVVARAAQGFDPSRIAEYCFELCKRFAFIFTDKDNHPIVTCEDPVLRSARLMLADAVGQTVKVSLRLLGIDVLEEM